MIKTSHLATLLLSATVTFAQGTPSPTGQAGQTSGQSSQQPTTQGQSDPKMDKSQSTSKTRSSRASDTSQSGDQSMVGSADRDFLMKAAEGGMMEVQLAQLAQKQASSEEVKQYAQKLEQDHTAANKQLMDIAQRRAVNVPSSLKPEDQQMIDKLTKLSGPEFDREYIKHMVKDHKKDVKEFERASNRGTDTDIKTFASSTVPTLREHLTRAESLEKTVKNSGTRSRTKDTMDHGSSNTQGTSGQGTTGQGTTGTSTTTPPPQR